MRRAGWARGGGFVPTDDRILNEFPWSGDTPRENFGEGWPFEPAYDQLIERIRRTAYMTSHTLIPLSEAIR